MQLLSGLFIFIISVYLSAVNTLAEFIDTAIFTPASEITSEITLSPSEAVAEKTHDVSSIPQILIENAAYQKAAVVESIAPEAATSTAYEALVNIYCEHTTENGIKVTTGTGFFIDTSGIILTNAHVAHFLLLDDIIGDSDCMIRTGNPAEPKYVAGLLYISPSWVRQNANMFVSTSPTGTGERDYALLYVTAGIDGQPMPGRFPALPFATELLKRGIVGQSAYVAGYPAESLFENGGRTPLIPKLATTTVAELMTFGSNYADVFTITGTEVGEHGASGGPVLTENGDVIGIISTKGNSAEFGTGALRAITLSYVDRTIKEETGYNLLQNLSGDIPRRARIFNETLVPFLRLVLQQQL